MSAAILKTLTLKGKDGQEQMAQLMALAKMAGLKGEKAIKMLTDTFTQIKPMLKELEIEAELGFTVKGKNRYTVILLRDIGAKKK